MQAWEYRPLGPFTAKAFATSISAWVVPLAELEPFRVPLPPQEPEPLAYLRGEPWAFDLALEIELNGGVVSRTSARNLYWSVDQQIAHLTAGGASLRTGDLLASGTISGVDAGLAREPARAELERSRAAGARGRVDADVPRGRRRGRAARAAARARGARARSSRRANRPSNGLLPGRVGRDVRSAATARRANSSGSRAESEPSRSASEKISTS